ncbi:MAG: hypothetical protein FD138_82 [Planctomycetota bacterium]|nr:MAG: hypothetical protein FD138_82 [Planctomycetota bacterium]
MLARPLSLRSTQTPRRFAAWRAVSLLMLSAVLSMVVGCASYDTYKKTVGNDTSEIDALTADAENPIPEIHPAAYSAAPITSKSLRDGQEIQYRDVTVGEVLQLALENSEVLRELGGTILRTPETVRTRYSMGLQQTDPRFGTHAALSAFDAQFKGSAMFNKNDRIFNNSFFAGGINSYDQDLHEYKNELSKRAATGALMIFRNVSDMDQNNAPGNLFTHAWNFYSEEEARQPLLQGGGLQYNRIAGPAGAPGLYNGILIARVNVDVTQTDFEIAVRDYVSNVVNVYWDLYYAYRDLDARRRAMHAALESWRKVKAQVEAEGLSASKEAQAREQYYRFKQEVDDSLSGRLLQGTQSRNGSTGGTLRANSGVQVNERRLRYMIGLPITDGTLLRPSQDPDEAEVIYDWEILMQESLARRPELRRQQLKVKRREMELLAAQNFIVPQLDAIARYRFRGFGNQLIQFSGDQGGGKPASALGNLATFDHQEWMAGFEFSMPIGFRQGHAAVANAELALCHERAIHREQEREIVHDLSNALSDAVRAFESCQSSLNRYIASREVLLSLEAEEKNGLPIDIDRILDAQRRVVEAEIRYYQSRSEYAVAQKNVQLERGALAGENDLWLIDGVNSSANEQQPVTVPGKVPPAPAPAADDAKPISPRDDAKRETSQNQENVNAVPEAAARLRQQAMTTLQQARKDLQAGRIDAAQQKAIAAQKLDASFTLWDDRPEALLDEIDKRSQAQKTVQSKKAEPNDLKSRATALVDDARADLAAGRISEALEKATQAAELDVAYEVFEDRPESVLTAIQRANHNTAAKSKPPAPDADKRFPAKSDDLKVRATALLKDARADLAADRVSEALEKATQAAELDVAYGVFEDRPESVLTAIQHATRNTVAKSKSSVPNATKRFPAKRTVQPTSAKIDELPRYKLEDSQSDPAGDRVNFVPPAPEPVHSLTVPLTPDEDDVSTSSPPQRFRDMRLEPSVFESDDDEDDDDEMWDESSDK